jgi:PAS domain-containing protein
VDTPRVEGQPLDDSEGQYRHFVEALPMGAVVWHLPEPSDHASMILRSANPAASTLLGIELGSRIGDEILKIFPRYTREHLSLLARAARGEIRAQSMGEVEIGVESPSGRLGSFFVIPLPDRCAGVVFDRLPSPNDAQRDVRTLNSFLDSIVENIPLIVFVKDAEHLCFERFNRAAENLSGLSREQVLGKNDFDFFPKDQAEFFQAKDREVLRTGCLTDIPEEPIQTLTGGPGT